MLTHVLGKLPSGLNTRSPAAARLDLELLHERASALGRFGRDLEAALHELSAFDARHPRPAPISPADRHTRSALVAEAVRALWSLAVQREACGLHDLPSMMDEYEVPAEVQGAFGAAYVPERLLA